MTPYYTDDLVTVHHGDCLDVLRALPDASVDAVVTDPPYGLEFMGREWDSFAPRDRQNASVWDGRREAQNGWEDAAAARSGKGGGGPSYRSQHKGAKRCTLCGRRSFSGTPCECPEPAWVVEHRQEAPSAMLAFEAWAADWSHEVYRVLKPGGYLLAFGGSRTWHRLACGVEDAGFEIRDSIAWLYGSGFPKSLDVSKAIDKAAGAEPIIVGPDEYRRARANIGTTSEIQPSYDKPRAAQAEANITAPATDAARAWQGWGTALKPAFEPIVVARKPLIGTVAANVLTHGTGALNIDGCRVAFTSSADERESKDKNRHADFGTEPGGNEVYGDFSMVERKNYDPPGRWPANVLLGHEPECVQVGTRTETVGGGEKASGGFVDGYESGDGFVGRSVASPVYRCAPGCQVAELDRQSGVSTSSGGANGGKLGARVYGSFANDSLGANAGGLGDSGGASRFFPTFRYEPKAPTDERPRDGDLAHPTVKPLDLMRWLVRLVTPGGGLVLDPFAGSGTTAEACVIESFRCIAIEREAAYLPLIVARLTKPIQPDLFGGAA